jgi:hypothetical protein
MLKRYKEFAKAVFLGINKISLHDAPTFGRARPPTSLEYRLNRSITLDPTIGSCSNFYKSCRRLFSYALQ